MGDTGKPHELPWPDGSNIPDVPADIQKLAEKVADRLDAIKAEMVTEFTPHVTRLADYTDKTVTNAWTTSYTFSYNASRQGVGVITGQATLNDPGTAAGDPRVRLVITGADGSSKTTSIAGISKGSASTISVPLSGFFRVNGSKTVTIKVETSTTNATNLGHIRDAELVVLFVPSGSLDAATAMETLDNSGSIPDTG